MKRTRRATWVDDITKTKLKKTALELSILEGSRISEREVLRRAFNIPNLSGVLREDAIIKRKLKKTTK